MFGCPFAVKETGNMLLLEHVLNGLLRCRFCLLGFLHQIDAEILERSLLWAEKQAVYHDRVRRVAELGIGLNPRAKVIGSTILDEKAAGTAHIAIGSNHWFGGDNSTIIHLDQVFFKPEIEFLERM